MTSDQNVKALFSNSSSGVILTTMMLGAETGLDGNMLVIDDPHKTREEPQSKEVESQVAA